MPPPIDLTGQQFGSLTVLSLVKNRNKFGQRVWLCKCKCGRENCLGKKIVSGNFLRREMTQSCGCQKLVDLTGRRFGKLTVLNKAKKSDKHGKRLWLCLCDCGRKKIILGNCLSQGSTQSCGCLLRDWRRSQKPIHKKKLNTALKEREAIFEDAIWWYSPRKAARYVGVEVQTLRKWKKCCYWLGGAGIATKGFPGALNRSTNYYSKKDLESLKKAISNHVRIPEVPGFEHILEACAQLDYSQRTLRRKMKNTRYKIKKHKGKSADSRVRPFSYVPAEFVTEEKVRLGIEDSTPSIQVPDQQRDDAQPVFDPNESETSGANAISTRGRLLDAQTTAVDHFCWKHHGKKPTVVKERAKNYFGEGVISDARYVKLFRERFEKKIKKYGLEKLMKLIQDVWVKDPAFA